MKVLFPGILAIATAVLMALAVESTPSTPELDAPVALAVAGQNAPIVMAEDGAAESIDWAYRAGYRSAAPTEADSPEGRDSAPVASDDEPSDDELTAIVRRTCVGCHNDQLETGNLSLQGFDVATAESQWETAEAMITKLRLEMMPPPGMPRPGGDTLLVLAETLERKTAAAAAERADPGSRSFQRLNRAEYERAIRDLLDLEVDASQWLPMDAVLAGFDNMSDAQTLSPALLDAYLSAAGTISRMTVGDPSPAPAQTTYEQSSTVSQHQWDRVEGAPIGTRGGIVVTHHFPADGEYVFEVSTGRGVWAALQNVDVSINGEQVALIPVEPGVPGTLRTPPISVPAGQHRVSAAFVRTTEGPYEDLVRPHRWSAGGGAAYGVTTYPHLQELVVFGPENPTGVSETQTRQKVFTCLPEEPGEERACAEAIVSRLASQAFRGPVDDEDFQGLMAFYEEGATEGGFENGVRLALQAILASPHFIFRIEQEPAGLRAGEVYQLNDFDLASRLSFFLWNRPPDDELRRVASEGRLSDPEVLEAQTRRMLADSRADALATRFAAQWLRLGNMNEVRPDPYWYPDFSENLRNDLRRETELFFDYLVRADRSVLELFTADYTFVNERLAQHYGIPGVVGDRFRRVSYPEGVNRRGILGHGSVLLLTSMGNRTSPVLRGVWVMETLLGSPPPPPPPNVPELDEVGGVDDGQILTTRQQLAIHRANPACSACHNMIDPMGVPLDNYDILGRWRTREAGVGVAVDPRAVLWDGTEVEGPADVVEALVTRPVPLVRNFVEYLMAYAVGRPMEYYDQPTIRAIVDAAEEDDYRLQPLILGVVRSDPFRMKRVTGVADEDAHDEGSRR